MKVLKILCIVGVIIIGLLALGTAATPKSSSSARPVAEAGEDGAAPAPAPQARQARPTAVPRPTATPRVGTKENPVPLGDGYTFRKGGRVYDVTVTDGERNALARVKRANRFNADPPEGADYIVTRLRIDYREGNASQPWRTPSTGYEYYAGNRMWGAPSLIVEEEPKLSGQNIFPGASVDGWLEGKHLPTELMAEALLVFDGVYFELP